MTKKLFFEYFSLLVLGVVTSFSLPPFNYFIINFISFSILFLFLIRKSFTEKGKKIFFFYGWLFGLGYFVTNLYWISISLTFDKSFKLLIPLSLILIPSFLGIFYGLVFYLFRILKPKKLISSFFLFSLIFGILEFIRGSILTGFPWNLIVYTFSNQSEILSIVSFIGTYGLNLICISLFVSPAIFILKNNKKNFFVSISFIIIFIFFYLHGKYYERKFEGLNKISNDFNLRVIGSQISIDRFYNDMDSISIINDLIKLSNPDPNLKTIFVWPEGILPGITKEEFSELSYLFEKKFNKNHLIIIGVNDQVIIDGSKKFYNTLSVYDHKLNVLYSYNKIKLVPFGEFLPFENILKTIGFKTITNNYQSFSKGEKRNIIELKNYGFPIKLLPLICYEIIYTGNLFKNSNFDFIVNISEDGWFGNSIGPKQHFSHSIFRAIENGKYVARSSNNGMTAIINPLGKTEETINFGDNGYVDFREYKKIKKTIFSEYGNKTFLLLSLLYIFLIFLFRK